MNFFTQNDEFLLLKGNDTDPQFFESFWYPVTGAIEDYDKIRIDAVKGEIKEETALDAYKSIYLNRIFEYKSLDDDCIEYAYLSFVKKNTIIL